MFKLTGERLANMAYRAKGHLHGAYNQAVKWGGHIDNIMNSQVDQLMAERGSGLIESLEPKTRWSFVPCWMNISP